MCKRRSSSSFLGKTPSLLGEKERHGTFGVSLSSRLDYGKLNLFLKDSVYPHKFSVGGVQVNRTIVETSLEISQKF